MNEICFDYSTDNGMTWVPQTAMLNPSVGTYNTRYPQMCIWNPAGNTDIANVKAVSTGPCADGTGWKASYLAVADLPTGVNTNYTFKPIATAIPMAPGSFDYGSFALCNLNGGIGYVAARMDASGSVQTPNYHAVDFWKITPNTTGGFDRTLKFSSIPEACEFSDTASFTYDMAFSPNGNIGYIAHVTADKNAQSCINYSRTPILYKTTDAGETWLKQPDFGFGLNYNALRLLQDSTAATVHNSLEKRAAFTNIRLVVDDLGKCHLFSEISSAISTAMDSTFFVQQGARARYVAHFIIDGNMVQSNFIYRSNNTDLPMRQGLGAFSPTFDAQYQAGRSADGKNIFFTTCQTTVRGTNTANDAPNLWVYAYRTTDNIFMPLRDFTIGTAAEANVFFPRLSPIVKRITGAHELPITVMTPGRAAGIVSDIEPVEFAFLSGIRVADTAYTNTMPLAENGNIFEFPCFLNNTPCYQATEKSNITEKITISPNPTVGIFLVDLTKLTGSATLTISDAFGRIVVYNQHQIGNVSIDLTEQPAGFYFINIKNGTDEMTAKVAIMR